MKKIFLPLLLFCATIAFAQPNHFTRSFILTLDKGDRMQIELLDIRGLAFLKNIDSILHVFVQDMAPLKDSLSNELLSKHIEYTMLSAATKQIRIRQYAPVEAGFVVNNGELSSLKFSQDTIVLNLQLPGTAQYCRASFFLNDINNLSFYIDGILAEKIANLQRQVNGKWLRNKEGFMQLKADPGILAAESRGRVAGTGSMISLRLSVDVQNYRDHFVPSATETLVFIQHNNGVRHEYGAGLEAHFLFSRNDRDKTKSFEHLFLTLSYSRSGATNTTRSFFSVFPYLSLGYLIGKKGDFYDPHTVKLTLGQFSLFSNNTKIEPVFYMEGFAKRLSPSLRLVQYF